MSSYKKNFKYTGKQKIFIIAILSLCCLNGFAQSLCGNGVIDSGEACDLGSSRNDGAHGCESNCKVSAASNGMSWTCTISPETYRYNVTSSEPTSLKSLFKAMRIRNFDTKSPDFVLNQKCGVAGITLNEDEQPKCEQFIREFIRFKDLNFNIAIKLADSTVTDELCPTGGLVIKQYNPVTLQAEGTYTVLCNQPTS